MSPGGISQDEITRQGLFWAGVEAVLESPAHVHKRLETALAKAKRAQPDEGDE